MKKEYINRPGSGYWDIGNCLAVDKAKIYSDLSIVAIDIAKRMPRPLMQICGPISTGGKGSIEANIIGFDKAIMFFIAKGFNIFDQIPFEEPMHRIRASKNISGYDQALLDEFYVPLFESGLIKKFIFLPDWESSKGSKWEQKQAERLGIEIIYLPDDWYESNYNLVWWKLLFKTRDFWSLVFF